MTLDEELIRQLYDRTGGVPLALVWSVAQMGFGYSPQAVLTRLGQPTNDITKFCFEGAVQRIKHTPAYALLLTLSLCADSANRESLGFATELPELDRDDGLVLLEKLSLINKQGERFWLLPLTKNYAAAEFAHYPERERLREQWVEYFRSLCEEYSQGKYYDWTSYEWLIAEGENILAIMDSALLRQDNGTTIALTQAVFHYLDIKGYWNKLPRYGKTLSFITEISNDKHALAWLYSYWMAPLYAITGDDSRAESLVKQSISLYENLNDLKGKCFAMNRMGMVLRQAGEYQKAVAVCTQAMDLAAQNQWDDAVASAHFELGRLARDLQDWESSKTHWRAILNWHKSNTGHTDFEFSSIISATANLGWSEFQLGNAERGKELIHKSLHFFESGQGRGYAVRLYRWLGIIEENQGNREKALEYAQKSLSAAKHMEGRELQETQHFMKELMENTQECKPRRYTKGREVD